MVLMKIFALKPLGITLPLQTIYQTLMYNIGSPHRWLQYLYWVDNSIPYISIILFEGLSLLEVGTC